MNKAERKQDLLYKYKQKWGLTKYKFFAHRSRENRVFFIHKDMINQELLILISPWSRWYFNPSTHECVNEVTSLYTLLKRMNQKEIEIIVYEYDRSHQVFESFNELKEYTLIRKLAGI